MIYIRRQQALVLVMTLWMLAILTVAASFFAVWTQRAIELAQELQTNLQGEIDTYNTQAQLIYLFSTRRLTMAGLNPKIPNRTLSFNTSADADVTMVLPVGGEIELDDTVYQGIGSARFSIQDKAGLFSLYRLSITLNPETKRKGMKLLGVLGVSAELREPLIARLQDYVDPDDFHRLNGAEAIHYEKSGLPPPANRLLINPMECRAILGWAEQESLWKNGIWGQITTTERAGFLNLNTASELVLQTLDGINAEIAKNIVARRKEFGAFTDYLQFQKLVGVEVGGDNFTAGYRVYPSKHFRISTWHEKSQRVRQQHVQLTPIEPESKPWAVSYSADVTLPLHRNKPIVLKSVFIDSKTSETL